ncbi:MAG: hypothetical protein WB947_06900 [Thermoplasmata archaeon]
MPKGHKAQTKEGQEKSGKQTVDWLSKLQAEVEKESGNLMATLMKIQHDRIRPCLICRKNFTEDGTAIFMRPMRNGVQVHVNLGLICDNCREGAIRFDASRRKS